MQEGHSLEVGVVTGAATAESSACIDESAVCAAESSGLTSESAGSGLWTD